MTQVIDVVDMDGVTHYVLDDGRIVPANNLSPAPKPSPSPAPSPMPNVANTAGQATGAYLANQGVGSLVGGGSGAGTAGATGTGATGGMSAGTGGGMSVAGSSGAAPTAGFANLGGALPVLGLAGMAYAGYENFKSDGGMDAIKGKGNTQKNTDAILNSNPMTAWVNPLTKFVGGKSVGSLIGGKSTKDYQKEREGAVAGRSEGWADFFNRTKEAQKGNKNEGYWDETTDPTGKYIGKKWSWDAQKDIMESTNNFNGLRGALGNAEVFGQDWFKLNDAQQDALVREVYNMGGYVSDKGSILIHKDKQQAAKDAFGKVVGAVGPVSTLPSEAQSNPRPQVDPNKVDTIFLDDNKPNGSTKRSASGMPGQLINPQTIMKSNNQSQAGKFSVPRPADIINQNSEVQDSALSPVADMETRMMQNPLINNPLFSLVRR
jgi:hypothetical protein